MLIPVLSVAQQRCARARARADIAAVDSGLIHTKVRKWEKMKFKNLVARAIIVQGIAMLVVSGANASAIIFYTGSDFISFKNQYTNTLAPTK